MFPWFIILFFSSIFPSILSQNCLGYNPLNFSCIFCNYDSFLPNKTPSPFNVSSCISKVSQNLSTRKVLISGTQNVSMLQPYFDSVYSDIFTCLFKENMIASENYVNNLVIYLAKEIHVFFSQDQEIQFFRRNLVDLTIQPLFCFSYNFSDFCVNPNEKITILMKSRFLLYISKNLLLNNIIIDGSDMLLASVTPTEINSNALNSCKNSTKICCVNSFFNNLFNENSANFQDLCGLKQRNIPRKKTNFQGVINFEVIYDAPDVILPSMKISNCTFSNFFLIDGEMVTFFKTEKNGQVLISNSTFDNFFMLQGLFVSEKNYYDLNLYKGTVGEVNLQNQNLLDLLINESFFNLSHVAFFFLNNTDFYFGNNNILDVIFFNFSFWDSQIEISHLQIEYIWISTPFINFLLFSMKSNLNFMQIDNIIIQNSVNFQFISLISGNCLFSNSLLSNISLSNQTFFDIQESNIIMTNLTFYVICNPFRQLFLSSDTSNISLNFINFSQSANFSSSFLSSPSNLSNIFFDSCSFIDNGLYFQAQDVLFLNLFMKKVISESQIFTFSDSNNTTINSSAFHCITSPDFVKPINLNFFFFLESILLNTTNIDNFIGQNTMVESISVVRSIFARGTITAFFFGLVNFIYCEIRQSYFYQTYHELNYYLYAFQIFEGFFLIIDSLFQDMQLAKDSNCMFDIETCVTQTVNTSFIFKDLVYGLEMMFLSFWESSDTTVENTTFVVDSYGFTYSMVEALDPTTVFTLRNSNFITLNKVPQNFSEALFVSGCPLVIVEGNLFANMQCEMDANDITKIVGAISFQGVSSFSGVYNELSLKFSNNTLKNCTCIYGGSVGIINYNKTVIENIISENSFSIQGGAFYMVQCYQIYFSGSFISGAMAKRGAAFYIRNNHYFNLTDCVFEETYGGVTGAIEAKLVGSMEIKNCKFSGAFSQNLGSVLCILASNLEISFTYFENSTSLSYGGAIYLNDLSNLTLFNSLSNVSLCQSDGGFLYAQSVYLINIFSITLVLSESKAKGGSLSLSSVNELILNNVSFLACKAKVNGIFFMVSLQTSNVISLTNITCANNHAFFGSCIFYSTPSDIFINGIGCFGNSGTMLQLEYVYPINTFIQNGNFSNNLQSGHIISISTLNVIIENMYFSNNSIYSDMIYLDTSQVDLSEMTFDYPINFSFLPKDAGSNIISAIASNISLVDGFFIGFQTSIVSSFFNLMLFKQCQVNISSSVFLKNIFSSENGQVYLEDTTFYVEMCLFSKNSGPIIKSFNSFVFVNGSFFEKNQGSEETSNDLDLSLNKQQSLNDAVFFFHSVNNFFEITNGISVLLNFLDELYINNTKFIGFSGDFTNGITIQSIFTSKIVNSFFYNLTSIEGSAVDFWSRFANSLSISLFSFSDSKIILCKNYFGGAIFINSENINISIMRNNFSDNMALKNSPNENYGKVGVLYFFNSPNTFSSFSMSFNLFSNNSAFILPTVYSNTFISENSNTFLNNSDDFNMTNRSSYPPYRFKLLNFISELSSHHDDAALCNISGGVPFTLVFLIEDGLNQTIIYDSISSASFSVLQSDLTSSQVKKIQNNFAIVSKGIFSFEKLIVFANPHSRFSLQLKTTFFDISKTAFPLIKIINFYSRSCVIGEILTLEGSCQQCPINYFSLIDPQNQTSMNFACKTCLNNAFCAGGRTIFPNNGFWRSSSNSLRLVACIVDSYCIGANVTNDELLANLSQYQYNEQLLKGLCLDGHQGNLCHECIFNFGKYTTNALCERCKDYNVIAIVRMAVVVIILLIYLYLNSRSMVLDQKDSTLFSEVSKIYINHIQRISVVVFLDITSLIESMKSFLSFLSTFNFLTEDIFSNDCFIQLFVKDQQYDFYIVKVFITLVLPIVIGVLSVGLIIMMRFWQRFIRRKRRDPDFLGKVTLIFLIAVFLFYPLITKSSLSLLNCISIDDSSREYMYNSPNLECWSSSHFIYFYFFGLSGILMFGIGYPLTLYFMIRNQKRKDYARCRSFMPSLNFHPNINNNDQHAIGSNNIMGSNNNIILNRGLLQNNSNLENTKNTPQSLNSTDIKLKSKLNNFFECTPPSDKVAKTQEVDIENNKNLVNLNNEDYTIVNANKNGANDQEINHQIKEMRLFLKVGGEKDEVIQSETKNIESFSSSPSNTQTHNNFLFFFYKEYKSDCYFWETLIFLQKFLLTMLPNLNKLIPEEIKNMLFFLVLIGYLLAVIMVFPFKREYINWLELNSIITNVVTKLCLILALSPISIYVRSICMFLQLLFNIFFFVHMTFILIKYTNWKALFKKSVKEISRMKNTISKMPRRIKTRLNSLASSKKENK